MTIQYPVAEPVLSGNEKAYVLDCLDSGWISSAGKYVGLFEEAFAEFCGTEHAMTCSNGTVALHLALLALGVGPGDEVIVPTLTYVATANAVAYCGARPVFVDAEPHTWNIDVGLIEEKITRQTKGIIVVHLYGLPVEMDPVLEIAEKYGLFIIEDAAQAHGAEYKGRRIGTLGHVATFSFYGNKIVTTGEGGMVVTNDASLAARIRQLKGQGMDSERRYWFPIIGYNYRMTNLAAAIGLAQLEKVEWYLARRKEIAATYREFLSGVAGIEFQAEVDDRTNVYWLSSIILGGNYTCTRDEIANGLAENGIETRPFFYPMHVLPMYARMCQAERFPVADYLGGRGLNLPSSARLTRDDIKYISACLLSTLRGY